MCDFVEQITIIVLIHSAQVKHNFSCSRNVFPRNQPGKYSNLKTHNLAPEGGKKIPVSVFGNSACI